MPAGPSARRFQWKVASSAGGATPATTDMSSAFSHKALLISAPDSQWSIQADWAFFLNFLNIATASFPCSPLSTPPTLAMRRLQPTGQNQWRWTRVPRGMHPLSVVTLGCNLATLAS